MRHTALVLAFFLASPAVSLKVDFSESSWKLKPIQKVVNLLKEMQGQIEKEAAEDAELYEQMGCWCETNDREKTQAIEIADQRITDLNAAIPEYAAKASTLEVDIKHLKKQVVENKEALDKATEVRAKEQEEFRSTEKEMIQSIASLKNAVRVMGKVHKDALPQESLVQVQEVLRKHHSATSLSSKQHHLVMSFIQGPSISMLQTGGKQPQSGAIFGILKTMKEEFENNVKTGAEDEAEAKAKFEEMEAAKKAEIKAGEDQVDTKTVELAEAKEKRAQSKEDLEDTTAAQKADREFLQNLKLKCQNVDHEYEQRQKVRSEELKAVSETISILTDDDAKDLMNKSMDFLQMSLRVTRKSGRNHAAQSLREAASKLHSPRLMTMALSMRMDAFGEVKKNIDAMVEALKKEQKEEVVQKDDCVSEFNTNDKQTAEASDLKDDLTQQIADLGKTIEQLTEAVSTLKGQLADTQTEMKRASQNREKENHEFQTTISEQRATQAILKKALDKLKAFYDAKAAALLQQQEDQEPGAAVPPPPPAAKEYKKSGGASGVMAMIETIVDESKQVESEAMAAETEAQSAYESFMKDSSALIEQLSKDVANKSEENAKADAGKVTAEDDLKHTVDSLLTLAEYGQELHSRCDFLVKNFNLRQESRASEIEALQSAKAIFSGVSM